MKDSFKGYVRRRRWRVARAVGISRRKDGNLTMMNIRK